MKQQGEEKKRNQRENMKTKEGEMTDSRRKDIEHQRKIMFEDDKIHL